MLLIVIVTVVAQPKVRDFLNENYFTPNRPSRGKIIQAVSITWINTSVASSMPTLGKRKAEDPLSDTENEDETQHLDIAAPALSKPAFLELDSTSESSDQAAIQEGIYGEALESYVQSAKSHILDRISERALPSVLENLTPQYEKLLHLLEQTVKTGESNSCLLIGNRGSGKSTLVRKVIESIRRDHEDNFLVVELNGLVQTDDRSALKEITRQLTRDSQMEGRTFVSCCRCLYPYLYPP